MNIKTAGWFTKLPEDHIKVGTSRGTPRGMKAGYRQYRKLAPGPWFKSVSVAEYDRLYRTEILGPLDPRRVAAELVEMGNGKIPCLVCFEKVGDPTWCHRSLIAEWLCEATGNPVPEFGHELLSQRDHPMMSDELRDRVIEPRVVDLNAYLHRVRLIDGEPHTVVAIDAEKPNTVIIKAGDRTFPAGLDTLRQYFSE